LLRFFPLALLALPLIEIALFIFVGRAIGVLPTLALVILAVIVGGLVLRQQGLSVLSGMRTNMSAGTLPGQTLFDGMALAIAAVFLIIPGFLGDFVAILLLLPPVRSWLYKSLTKRKTIVSSTAHYGGRPQPGASPLDAPKTIDLDDDDWQRK